MLGIIKQGKQTGQNETDYENNPQKKPAKEYHDAR